MSTRILFLLCLLACGIVHAQNDPSYFTSDEDNNPLPPPQLYNLNPLQENHHFHIRLPDNGILDIDFQRLSDWGDRNRLQDIAALANAQVQHIKDSFRYNHSAKLVTLNVPIQEDIISIGYDEHATGKGQLAYSNGNYYQLKTDFDTIRIIRNISIREKPGLDSGLVQIRYNFILKDISDLDKLVRNPTVLEKIGNELDQVIADKRKQWKNPDASYYQLLVDYDVNKEKPVDVVSDRKIWSPFIHKKIGLYLSIGAVFFRNSISPFFDYTLAYKLPSRGKAQRFVGLNMTSFALFNNDLSLQRNYTSLNAEVGVFSSGGKQRMGLLGQKTALAYGVMFDTKNGDLLLLNLSLSFGVTPYMSFGFGAASNFKKDDSKNILYMNMKFNL